MKPEELKEIINCVLDGKEFEIHGTTIYYILGRSSIKLSEIFQCKLTIKDIELNLHKVISTYPELFSLYGISVTPWNIYYQNKVVQYTFK